MKDQYVIIDLRNMDFMKNEEGKINYYDTEDKAYDVIFMRSYELHTMKINRRKSCVWMFEEFPASCKYIPINYSKLNLLNWSPDGLYIEVGDDIRDKYIGRFL